MGESVDANGIAARLRAILGMTGGHDQALIEQVAARLRVSEFDVGTAVRDRDPEPDIMVLIAVVREYGVDPTWLITGDYDLQGHRTAIEETDQAMSALTQLMSRHPTPTQTEIGIAATPPMPPPLETSPPLHLPA